MIASGVDDRSEHILTDAVQCRNVGQDKMPGELSCHLPNSC